jgi:hypothetical protein
LKPYTLRYTFKLALTQPQPTPPQHVWGQCWCGQYHYPPQYQPQPQQKHSHTSLLIGLVVVVIIIGVIIIGVFVEYSDSYVYVGTVDYCTVQQSSNGCSCAFATCTPLTLSTTNKVVNIIQVSSSQFELVSCGGTVWNYSGYIISENVQKVYWTCL